MKVDLKRIFLPLVFACVQACPALGAPSILLADFEGDTYPGWTITGEAFGQGPVRGTLPHQMPVTGFSGNGLVNSFKGGDRSTGKVTSAPFKIERRALQFLIGGGGWDRKTCMNLLVNGKIARTATGPNTNPGGSEKLEVQQWDVREFEGQTAVLEIVDQATGTWGHINVDEIVQTDVLKPELVVPRVAERSFAAQHDYLHLPVKTGAPKRRVSISSAESSLVREFDIELADGEPDWWAFMDLKPFKGKTITVSLQKAPPHGSNLMQRIYQSDTIVDQQKLYRESRRPQFHFSSRRGWLNDPNGLVYFKGDYHLFYQHNPYGWNWGNMHWGHAVSRDLVHWKEMDIALYPDALGTMYSGSAVVDWHNTAGFQTGKEPALVAIYTAAGQPFTQCIAYSNDGGRTWTKYENNPVLPHIVHENRDPRVFWYEPGKKWVMALYLDRDEYGIFGSKDLKEWERLSSLRIPGDSECPELFEIPVQPGASGKPGETRWIFYGANGLYLVGRFDGTSFHTESGPHPLQHGNCWYASQTFSDIPASDGRRVLIPWGRMTERDVPFHQGMPFNQMMGLPVSLTLRPTEAGLRLFAEPVQELESLRGKPYRLKRQLLQPGKNPLAGIRMELLDLELEIEPGSAEEINLNIQGEPIVYNVRKQELSCARRTVTMKPENGKIRLRVLGDRTSLDIFGNDGAVYMSIGKYLPIENSILQLDAVNGTATIQSLSAYPLTSAWPPTQP